MKRFNLMPKSGLPSDDTSLLRSPRRSSRDKDLIMFLLPIILAITYIFFDYTESNRKLGTVKKINPAVVKKYEYLKKTYEELKQNSYDKSKP